MLAAALVCSRRPVRTPLTRRARSAGSVGCAGRRPAATATAKERPQEEPKRPKSERRRRPMPRIGQTHPDPVAGTGVPVRLEAAPVVAVRFGRSASISRRSCRRTCAPVVPGCAGLKDPSPARPDVRVPSQPHRDPGEPVQTHRVRDRARADREGADREGRPSRRDDRNRRGRMSSSTSTTSTTRRSRSASSRSRSVSTS